MTWRNMDKFLAPPHCQSKVKSSFKSQRCRTHPWRTFFLKLFFYTFLAGIHTFDLAVFQYYWYLQCFHMHTGMVVVRCLLQQKLGQIDAFLERCQHSSIVRDRMHFKVLMKNLRIYLAPVIVCCNEKAQNRYVTRMYLKKNSKYIFAVEKFYS